jgi:asparagine synthase (glutamine-hydrolysing)
VPEAVEIRELEERLQESVRLRLVSDVPIGAFLSGGIDSSVVVALMAREMTRPVTTFSIGFEEQAYNELPYARLVARHLGTDHHELVVGPGGCELIEKIVGHFDEPFGDPSAIPTYYLSKLAADHVKVVLSGDGGDELFAGYDRYGVDLRRSRFDALPQPARVLLRAASDRFPDGWPGKRWLRNVSLPARQRYLENNSYLAPRDLNRLLTREFQMTLIRDAGADRIFEGHFDQARQGSWLAQLQYLDIKTYLPADVLTKVDRMSMAHSLEAREPLLDQRLVEHVAGLPDAMKYRDGVSKYLLKKVAEKMLPSEIIHRKKQGFGVPLEYWFRKDQLNGYVRDVLFDSRTRGRGIVEPDEAARVLQRYERGEKELASTIWLLVVMEVWCRLYMDRVPSSLEPEQCAA